MEIKEGSRKMERTQISMVKKEIRGGGRQSNR